MDSIQNNLKPEVKEETEEEKIDIVPRAQKKKTNALQVPPPR